MSTWHSEVADSLRKAAAILTAVGPLPPPQSWADGDRSAPNTPWGRAQGAYFLAPGVRWFYTSNHGGLGVSRSVAHKLLSDAALKLAHLESGIYWYEEDAQFAIAFMERPEWGEALKKAAGGSAGTKQSYEDTVREYFPKYFELQTSGFKMPGPLKVGGYLQFTRDVRFGSKTFKKGDIIQIAKLTASSILFSARPGYDVIAFRVSKRLYNEGDLRKVDGPNG